MLQWLVHDPALVSRTMVEDVLRFKRLDGVTAALDTIARAWFPGGRQALDVTAAIARAGAAGAGDLGARRSDHSGGACPGGAARRAGACAGGCRSSAAHGEVRRGEPADPPVHRLVAADHVARWRCTLHVGSASGRACGSRCVPAAQAAYVRLRGGGPIAPVRPPPGPLPLDSAGQGATPRRRNSPRSGPRRRYSAARGHRARRVPAPSQPPARISPGRS